MKRTAASVDRLARRVRRADGFTLIELVIVMAILVTIVTAITALFTTAAKSALEEDRRFQAQQTARVAVDKMRREVHCATSVTSVSATSVTVNLPAGCQATGAIVYDTQLVSTGRYRLRRAGVQIADYLTSGSVFAYTAPTTSSLGKLALDLRVNVRPNEGWKTWRLTTDIVLRNTSRS
jgi:prepilin-type N-terminal cleavage/methylation domain-containing protein